jgi:hypothetical protein
VKSHQQNEKALQVNDLQGFFLAVGGRSGGKGRAHLQGRNALADNPRP